MPKRWEPRGFRRKTDPDHVSSLPDPVFTTASGHGVHTLRAPPVNSYQWYGDY